MTVSGEASRNVAVDRTGDGGCESIGVTGPVVSGGEVIALVMILPPQQEAR